MIYILDKSASMGKTFANLVLPGCAMLHRKINPEAAHVVLFGETVTSQAISNSHFFETDAMKNTPLEEATDIAGGFQRAMEIALRDLEASKREMEDQFFERAKQQIRKEDIETKSDIPFSKVQKKKKKERKRISIQYSLSYSFIHFRFSN
jgi:hypothetical protein